MEPLLQVEHLAVSFTTEAGRFRVVDDVSFSLAVGQTLGLVGESGCGKSVTALSLLGLLPRPAGEVVEGRALFQDQDLLTLTAEQRYRVRGNKIAMIFQEPMTALNPVHTVGRQLMEVYQLHRPELTKRQQQQAAAEMLHQVGIPEAEARLKSYPHQLSGGMRQRVMIAIALACDPKVLIADEPTTALDVTIQAQILELMKELRTKLGMAVIWITHDLGVIAGIADRVIVMYGGQIVEHAPVRDLFSNPQHPYTEALLTTIPTVTGARSKRLTVIEGQPPILGAPPEACPFRERCKYRFEICDRMVPARYPIGENHDAACFRADTALRKDKSYA